MTIEDAAELRLQQPHVVRLESRPAGVEGRGEVTIRDLLRNALRMRPDRIVIGEVRGAEALDLLTALNTGHDGALSTVHANSPADALDPAGDAGADGGRRAAARGDRRAGAARASTSSSTSSAAPDGSRRVTEIAEVGDVTRLGADRCRGPALAAGCRRRWWRSALPRRRCWPAPRLARWLRLALEPLRRAGREGYAPSTRRAPPARGPRPGPARSSAAGSLGWADAGAAARGRRAGARRLGDLQPPPPLPRARSSARCRKSATAIADSLTAGRSLRASLAGRGRLARRAAGGRAGPARRRARARGARPVEAIAALAAADALGAGRRLRRRAAQPAARRRRPRRAAAPLRRRGGGARPGRRGRPLGHRPGPLHRPAGRGDADRRRALRRADPARLPRQAAGLAGLPRCCSRSRRLCSSPASSRSGASRGWSSERRRRAGGARRPARLRGRPGAGSVAVDRQCRRCRSA